MLCVYMHASIAGIDGVSDYECMRSCMCSIGGASNGGH